MGSGQSLLALDVGERRIGVALASGDVHIALPYETIEVDGAEHDRIAQLIVDERIDIVVVGYPRNQSGESTAQTAYVERFADIVRQYADIVVYQDESLTSVVAEQRLNSYGKPYEKGDIDALAASIVLQDYLEAS